MNHPAIDLLDKWLADESGYDERAYPRLQRALRRNPVRMFHHRGFTLIELLIVPAILGILAGVVMMGVGAANRRMIWR